MTQPNLRRPFVAGNWKLHYTVAESEALARGLAAELPKTTVLGDQAQGSGVEVAVAPVFTALTAVKAALADSGIGLSSQNLSAEESGAFTGEVGPLQIRDVGCT